MALSLYQHHCHGRLDDRDAVLAALEDAGWPAGPALGLVTAIEQKGFLDGLPHCADEVLLAEARRRGFKVPAAWRSWTDDEVEAVYLAFLAAGRKMPSMAVCRELAAKLGRTVKSVRSQVERLDRGLSVRDGS